MNKYVLIDETRTIDGRILHRIKALKDFGNVKTGDLGGFIEKEKNLSQEGHAWIYNNAWVFDNAQVLNNARICDDARIYGSALIRGDVRVFGNAQVYEGAQISGGVLVYRDAIISQNQYVSYGSVKTDLSKPENLVSSIKVQCNLPAIDNKVIAYKLVKPNLTSFYDNDFQYEIGKEVEVENCDESNEPCASGLHFSNLTYWDNAVMGECVYLEAEIELDDIITVQLGKIRCRKAKILRSFSL